MEVGMKEAMERKEQYRILCETEGDHIPLFLQYWWMDTVCQGKHWDVALAYASDGSIAAAMPYLIGSKLGLRYVVQPQLTQYNGPWYRPGADIEGATRQLATHISALRLALFCQNFAPSDNTPDGWAAYEASPRVTYRIDDISDPQQVFAQFDKRRRQRQIRQAETILRRCDLSATEFAAFHTQYWQSRGQKDLLAPDFMQRTINAALRRNQGLLIGLKDHHGTLHAARFVAYDSQCAYALLSALNPEGHANGASALLFWHIIQQLSSTTRCFDFEGSMVPSIAYSYRLYGARPTTYYRHFRCPIPFLRTYLREKT